MRGASAAPGAETAGLLDVLGAEVREALRQVRNEGEPASPRPLDPEQWAALGRRLRALEDALAPAADALGGVVGRLDALQAAVEAGQAAQGAAEGTARGGVEGTARGSPEPVLAALSLLRADLRAMLAAERSPSKAGATGEASPTTEALPSRSEDALVLDVPAQRVAVPEREAAPGERVAVRDGSEGVELGWEAARNGREPATREEAYARMQRLVRADTAEEPGATREEAEEGMAQARGGQAAALPSWLQPEGGVAARREDDDEAAILSGGSSGSEEAGTSSRDPALIDQAGGATQAGVEGSESWAADGAREGAQTTNRMTESGARWQVDPEDRLQADAVERRQADSDDQWRADVGGWSGAAASLRDSGAPTDAAVEDGVFTIPVTASSGDGPPMPSDRPSLFAEAQQDETAHDATQTSSGKRSGGGVDAARAPDRNPEASRLEPLETDAPVAASTGKSPSLIKATYDLGLQRLKAGRILASTPGQRWDVADRLLLCLSGDCGVIWSCPGLACESSTDPAWRAGTP